MDLIHSQQQAQIALILASLPEEDNDTTEPPQQPKPTKAEKKLAAKA